MRTVLTAAFLVLLAPLARGAPEDERLEQTIRVGRLSYKLYLDPDFELEARASSGLPVSFRAAGDCSLSGATVHILGAGKCLVTASQPGDERYRPAPDVELRIPIGKAGQTIDFPDPPRLAYLDPDYDLEAAASSRLPVTYFAYGDCEVSGPSLRVLNAGECTVTAHQPGDDDYTAARIVERRFRIHRAAQAIAFLECRTCGRNQLPFLPEATSRLPVRVTARGACAAGYTRIHIVATGVCTVLAEQPGSANFEPAPPLERSFDVVLVE